MLSTINLFESKLSNKVIFELSKEPLDHTWVKVKSMEEFDEVVLKKGMPGIISIGSGFIINQLIDEMYVEFTAKNCFPLRLWIHSEKQSDLDTAIHAINRNEAKLKEQGQGPAIRNYQLKTILSFK